MLPRTMGNLVEIFTPKVALLRGAAVLKRDSAWLSGMSFLSLRARPVTSRVDCCEAGLPLLCTPAHPSTFYLKQHRVLTMFSDFPTSRNTN